MSARSLYATLIGINAYPRNPLNGCVHDVLSMDQFLRTLCAQQDGNAQVAPLSYRPAYFIAAHASDKPALDSHFCMYPDTSACDFLEPTFNQVTTRAFEHLKSAKDGDICLLYYSGHGSTIEAPEEFRGSKSRLQHETIVCMDSRSGARDLLDKEIAFLLWDALKDKNVHCLVIMDCCFAGNNTRAIEADTRIGYRHVADAYQQLPLQEYIGFNQGFYRTKPGGGVEFEIGTYVQLAASMDNQTAQETALGGGLFTSQLLDALRKGSGTRSYRDLIQATRVSVRDRNPKQTPVGFAANDSDLDMVFLGGAIAPYRPTFEVRFDDSMQKWKLFGGAMDGLVSSLENPTHVRILGSDRTFSIAEVHSNFSFLDAEPGDLEAAAGNDFQAIVTTHAMPYLEVCLSNSVLENADKLEQLREAYADRSAFPYVSLYFEKAKQDAPYQVRLTEAGDWMLVRTGSTIPLFKRENNPSSLLENADYVGKWLMVSSLKNTDTSFSASDFTFRLERIEGKKLTPGNLDTVPGTAVCDGSHLPEEVVFKYMHDQQPAFRLQIGIHPEAPTLRDCYVGAIYLQSKYGILTDLIKEDAQLLEKNGEPVSLMFYTNGNAYKTLPLTIDSKYALYGINEIVAQMKIVVSRAPIHLSHFKQDNLELDELVGVEKSHRRGEIFLEAGGAYDHNDWCVFGTRFRVIGPNKGKQVTGGHKSDFTAFTLDAPDGFEALAYAASGDDIIQQLANSPRSRNTQGINPGDDINQQLANSPRSRNTQGINPGDDINQQLANSPRSRNTQGINPAANLFDSANALDHAFTAGISGNANNGVQVLELRPAGSQKAVSLPAGKELRLVPKLAVDESDTIVPYGYDEDSGLYFPIGYTDSEGVVHIDQLPPPSSGIIEELDAAERERSLGRSIKLFFHKVAWSRITGIRNYNRLTLHQRGADGSVTPVTYRGTPQTKAEAVKIADAVGSGRSLLLIHGIIGDTDSMVQAFFESDALLRPFDNVLSFDYENLHSGIQESADSLKKMLLDCGLGNGKQVTIVAHSMGGLVARYIIEHLEGHLLVDKLIQCGTPNSGSELADFRRRVTSWLLAGLNGVAIYQPYMAAAAFLCKRIGKAIFQTLDQMDPSSTFLARLNASGKSKPMAQYFLIGGDTSNIAQNHPEDASKLKKIFATLTSRGIYTGLDKAVFDMEPNDMAVKVDRMKALPWGAHHRTAILDCDHMSYFSDPKSLATLVDWLA